MAQRQNTVLDTATWDRVVAKVQTLSPARQEEILDYINFIVEREDADEWDLTEADREQIARHFEGDLSDTVSLEEAKRALQGDADEL